ncbi:hypothetical protein [Actinomadura fibrosa]|uniref:Uncharacterized protein n=1 Tax=Actinomadura fibrosa TaxID=111802 RepID=A0ABW2Y0G2_9ACTN|nr:hypothetical protein [Actinomadura fibrosa]
MDDHFAYASGRIRSADGLRELLAATFDGLELLERAATALAESGDGLAYRAAVEEASDAWWALAGAPALRPSTGDAGRHLADTLSRFTLLLSQALVTATSRSADPADRVACLQAAQHVGRVHAALA